MYVCMYHEGSKYKHSNTHTHTHISVDLVGLDGIDNFYAGTQLFLYHVYLIDIDN